MEIFGKQLFGFPPLLVADLNQLTRA